MIKLFSRNVMKQKIIAQYFSEKMKIKKEQAGAELGQAQLKLELDCTLT